MREVPPSQSSYKKTWFTWLLLLFLLFIPLLLKVALAEDENMRFKAWKPLSVHSMMWKDVRGLGVASVRVHYETRLEQRKGAEVRTASVKLEPEGSIVLFLASAWGGLLVEDESGNLYLNIFPHKIRNTRISEKKHWDFLLISEKKKETSGYLLSWKAAHRALSLISHFWFAALERGKLI